MGKIIITLFMVLSIGSLEAEVGEEKKETRVSWYGGRFHGRKTASGKIYDKNQLVAASPTLPFGTEVEITNKKNGKTVVVTVIDRGPFKIGKEGVIKPLQPHPRRAFDLSEAAFEEIANLDRGVINVTYKILNL